MLQHLIRDPLRIGKHAIDSRKRTKSTPHPFSTIRSHANHWKILVNHHAVRTRIPLHPPVDNLTRFIQANAASDTHDAPVHSAMLIPTHKREDRPKKPQCMGTRQRRYRLTSNNIRPGTYQFRESILKRRVVLRTPYFSYLRHLILSRLALTSLSSYVSSPLPSHVFPSRSPPLFHTCIILTFSLLSPHYLHA
jgi:hypothetical protein